MSIETYIEQLQEMGKTLIGGENIKGIQEILLERGYVTRLESTDMDYLVLVERIYKLKINGAWYVDAMPTKIIIENLEGWLDMVDVTPFRMIQELELKKYNGYHPRKCKGQPLPSYLYRFYGLEKSEESLTEVTHVRVTPSEKEKLESYGANLDDKLSPSEVVRKYIRGL